MSNDRPASLTDLLHDAAADLRDAWSRTDAARDLEPLPAGTYIAHVHGIKLFRAKTGTPGAKIRFDVLEGEHAGRRLFFDCWLTPAALPCSKRDLAKLGITELDQLESGALPPGRIRCKVRVAQHRADDGRTFDRVRAFDVIGIDDPPADPSLDPAFGPDDVPSDAPPQQDCQDDDVPF